MRVKILITGICGFVGNQLARHLRAARVADRLEIIGIDNLSRPGSESNRHSLDGLGVRVLHGDIRMASDLEAVGPVDWVIDAAANASVLAGVDGRTSTRQLIEHNLLGTVNLLEYCRSWQAGFVLLSTSRVYSLHQLEALPMDVVDGRFVPALDRLSLPGIGGAGVTESFSTAPPLSLYGTTKVASELLALEYHYSFRLPVWINRCGVLAGAGQFGHAAQGIFAYWINAHLRRAPLRYIGFDGSGRQVRDCLHPSDLARLVLKQIECAGPQPQERLFNVAGGVANSISLLELTRWCDERFGAHTVEQDTRPRQFDVPWLVLDSERARSLWGWSPDMGVESILTEIAEHAQREPEWLQISGALA